MKKNLNLSVFAAIVAVLTINTSCSKDKLVEDDTSHVPMPMEINLSIGDLSVTRATKESSKDMTSIDGLLKQNVLIGVYTKDADGKYYQKAYKVTADGAANTVTTITPANTTTSGKFYWGAKNETKVIEAFSYGETAGNVITPNIVHTALADGSASYALPAFTEFEVDADQSFANASNVNKELLYWYGRIAYTETAQTIHLNHQLARVNIEVTTPKQASELTNVMTVHIGKAVTNTLTYKTGDSEVTANTKNDNDTQDDYPRGIALAGTFTKPAAFDDTYKAATTTELGTADKFGTWAVTTTAAKLNQAITPRVTTAEEEVTGGNGYKTCYSAIVIPQNFEHKYMFVINYDGAEYIYTGVAGDLLEAGKVYTYQITVGPKFLNVTQAQITDWAPVDKGTVNVELQ